MCESGDWFLLHENAPSHNATIVKQFLDQRNVNVLDHNPYSPDLTPADYFLFPKVISHLKVRLFDSISDIQKAMTSTWNTIAKDDFYKGIQKLSFIHSIFCLTTGSKPPPKRCLHTVRSRASSFKWEYPVLSLRSSSSFLSLLPRLLTTSISSFIFPSITCFRRQFLPKMSRSCMTVQICVYT